MRTISSGPMASLILLTSISFAQASDQAMLQPPASWVAFEKQENAKRAEFMKQIKADTDAFLSTHPEAKAYYEQRRAAFKAKLAAWKAAHPQMNINTTAK